MTVDTYRSYREWATTKLATRPQVSVVIPAYNEEIRILPTVGAIATHMSSRGEPWELIVADDGSSDTTVALLSGLRFPNMRVLTTDRNGGKGSAVRRGIAAASGEYILFADADQSTPIEQFDHMFTRMREEGLDLLVGSRAAHGARVSGKSILRRVLSRGLRTFVRVLFDIRVRDTQCGFKLFRAETAREIFARQVIDGFSFDLEIIYLCHRLGFKVDEIPVEWIDAPGSKVDEAKVVARFLVDLAHIRLNDLRGRYEPRPTVSASVPAPRSRTHGPDDL
ncbi:MAG: glycosyltransferase [Actinomycetota bacterium]|nr:glycosyltransferase [Actinomycetota bacterium]